jgi:hypothetical protein
MRSEVAPGRIRTSSIIHEEATAEEIVNTFALPRRKLGVMH